MNTIRGLGEEVEEAIVVQKIIRTLPKRFNPKISFVSEKKDLKTMKIDQLHGTLVAYKIRIEDKDMSRKEETFKVSSKKVGKKNEQRKSRQVMNLMMNK